MQFGKLIEGLQILAKYEENGLDAYVAGADHDVFWAAAARVDAEPATDEYGDAVRDDSRLSAEDNARLRELGWFVSEDESWTAYV